MAPKEIDPSRRRTGVVPGSPRSYRRVEERTSGFDVLVIGGLLVIAALVSAWYLTSQGVVGGPGASASPTRRASASPGASPSGSPASSGSPSATASDDATDGSTDEPTDEPSGDASPSPTEAAALPSDEGSEEPTDAPFETDDPAAGAGSDEPTDEPTDEAFESLEPTVDPFATEDPFATDEPGSTPQPTATAPPDTAFTIDSIDTVTTVRSQPVDIAGAAPPGATITRDVPMWFDDHVTARPSGRWTMRVGLSEGENVLRFRLGDDRSTEIVLRITYRP